MALTVVVIAQGEMGSGIGQRLHERGARVLTSLAGRSAASAARAASAGMEPVNDDATLVAEADFVLSVIPPGEAVPLARRLAPALAASAKKPVYVDGNAISPARAREVGAVIAPTGCAFVDGGIIGGPPSPGKSGARIHVSGPDAARVLALRDYGLDIRIVEGGIGAASALKCSYAALTKGTQALGIALILGAMRAGVAPALRQELAESQPALRDFLARQIPNVYRKAYRWVAEMEEIGDHLGATADPGARDIYRGMARLFEHLAEGDKIALVDEFLER
jgi:3-hydroxyisobutyrate dehydrogenase-like beta-hydroxyacid dehydrogenase